MKRIRTGGITGFIVLSILFGMVAQSCSSSKKCGCKGDLTGAYKPRKKYR